MDQTASWEATCLLGAADELRETIGAPIPQAEHDAYTSSISALRTQLGKAEFTVAWNQGRGLPLAELLRSCEAGEASIDVRRR
jgi:hypothetical protein